MHPFIIVGEKVIIPTYGMCVATGYLFSLLLFHYLRSRTNAVTLLNTTIISTFLIISGLFGSFLLGLIVNGIGHRHTLVLYGGILMSTLSFPFIAKIMGLDIKAEMDYISIAVLPGQAFGRIGCLMAGCCYGFEYEGRLAVVFHSPLSLAPEGTPLFPIQLIEAVCDISLFVLLFSFNSIKSIKVENGLVSVLYFIGYGVMRFFLEFGRGDTERGFVGIFSTSQVLAFLSICISTLYLADKWLRNILDSKGDGCNV